MTTSSKITTTSANDRPHLHGNFFAIKCNFTVDLTRELNYTFSSYERHRERNQGARIQDHAVAYALQPRSNHQPPNQGGQV